MSCFDVILVPTDFSMDSYQAFELACSVARDQFSSIVVVHVLPPDVLPESDNDLNSNCETAPIIRQCREQFRQMSRQSGDIPISFRIAFGYVVGTILNVAHEENAELIVIASHHHSRFHLQLHGSVTEGLLRQSHCPVMCLRQPSQISPVHSSAAKMAEET